ncbi:surface-adhesin E family protein [Sphingomonas soli]|uniref:surface-adhesin E family protein n=1 Tax=Sphingomonas soli TaxID=266127 RepID=UPI000A4F2518|nr:surface-adhesin E family protein [Sphingomonas soli]
MRKLAIAAALALVVFPATASAEAWYRVGGNKKTISYVDLDSLRNIAGKIIVVTRSIYAEPLSGEIYGAAIRSEYDCANKNFRTLEYSYYTKTGALISTEPSQTINELKVPAPGSINEAMMDFICFRKGGTLVTNPVTDAEAKFPTM